MQSVHEEQRQARKLVFLSHAAKDRAATDELLTRLEEAGISCWVAPRDVGPGANFGASVIDAIQSAELMVLVLSSHSNNSQHVANEIERAAHYRKPIVPVRLEDVLPAADIELHVAARQWVDIWKGHPQKEANMATLINTLRGKLRTWLVPDLPPLPDAAKPPASLPRPVADSTRVGGWVLHSGKKQFHGDIDTQTGDLLWMADQECGLKISVKVLEIVSIIISTKKHSGTPPCGTNNVATINLADGTTLSGCVTPYALQFKSGPLTLPLNSPDNTDFTIVRKAS